MTTAMLQEFFEARRRIDAGMQADLVAWRRGLLSIDEVIVRGLGRQFERRWLGLRIGLAGKTTPAPFDTASAPLQPTQDVRSEEILAG